MPNTAVRAACEAMPCDNRPPLIRLMDDITDLARMASITYGLIEEAFWLQRAKARDEVRQTFTFDFSREWIDQIMFASANVMDRARSLHSRVELIDHLAERLKDRAPHAALHAGEVANGDRYELLSSLEGALATIDGLTKAVDELSGLKNDPERRLSGICAITGPLAAEIERAKQACRNLYAQYFPEKSTA